MSDQLTLELEAVNWIPQTKQVTPEYYDCFTLDHDEIEAAAKFRKRFGYPPDEIYQEYGLLWLGPVR